MKISKNLPKSNKPDTAKALDHIRCAIDILGPAAKTDPVAKEALINLGVIAVDLNSKDSPRR